MCYLAYDKTNYYFISYHTYANELVMYFKITIALKCLLGEQLRRSEKAQLVSPSLV